MATERSLILLKPDCVTKAHCGTVIERYEKAGFKIRGAKMMRLSDEILAEHYAHVADNPFFPNIRAFMPSSPVIAMIQSGSRIRQNSDGRALAFPCLLSIPWFENSVPLPNSTTEDAEYTEAFFG